MIKSKTFFINCLIAMGVFVTSPLILLAQTDPQFNELGSVILNAFKTNDYYSMEKYQSTMSDMEEYIEKVAGYYSPDKQRDIILKKNEYAKDSFKKIFDSFRFCRESGIASGINWSNAKLVSISTEYCGEKPIPKEMIIGVSVKFSYLGVEYGIDAFVIKGNRGLIFIAPFKFH